MTDYRERPVRGILIPCDDRVEINWEPETKKLKEWLELANIEWVELVNNSHGLNFEAIMDDNGLNRGLPWNARAQFILGYPVLHPIVGSIVLCSVVNSAEGRDIGDLDQRVVEHLTEPEQADRFNRWLNNPSHRQYFNSHRLRYPQPI